MKSAGLQASAEGRSPQGDGAEVERPGLGGKAGEWAALKARREVISGRTQEGTEAAEGSGGLGRKGSSQACRGDHRHH